jgi:PPOX class probable F420-dependent enzyme
MSKMSREECFSFLLEQTHTGKLATVRIDGRPHVAPIWFAMDGEVLVFTTWHASVKARNIQRDARVCLCVDDEQAPFSYVQVEGTATLSDNPEELRLWATRIGGKYMGMDQATAYGQRNGVVGELLVRIVPTHVIGEKNITE